MAKDDADGDASEGASHPRRRHRHRHHLSAPSNQPPVAGQPVEARSLSGITAIASNPPSYPRNPTQQKLDPLVLYIVRVPGSKGMRVRSLCSIYMLTTYEKKKMSFSLLSNHLPSRASPPKRSIHRCTTCMRRARTTTHYYRNRSWNRMMEGRDCESRILGVMGKGTGLLRRQLCLGD